MKPDTECMACSNGLPAGIPHRGTCHHMHEQVVVWYPAENRAVSVDEGIVETIIRLWEAGVRTFSSCQGHRDGRERFVITWASDASRVRAVLPSAEIKLHLVAYGSFGSWHGVSW